MGIYVAVAALILLLGLFWYIEYKSLGAKKATIATLALMLAAVLIQLMIHYFGVAILLVLVVGLIVLYFLHEQGWI